ncbi:MAG: accessory factor associated with RNA polymerase II [Peltula sp. TS41687]|nr:MAG: accessory factor associated with RNA polymerase II [Peltula sp. TS41687]
MTDENNSPLFRPGLDFFRPRSIRRCSEKSRPSTSPVSTASQLSPYSPTPAGISISSNPLIPTRRRPASKSKDSNGSNTTKDTFPSPSEASSDGSASSVARRVFGFAKLRHSSSTTKEGPPRREAKDGFAWKLLPNGNWLEKEKRGLPGKHKRRSDEVRGNGPDTPNRVHAIRPTGKKSDSDGPRRNSSLIEYTPSTRSKSWDLKLEKPILEKDGFFHRSKRFIKGIGRTSGPQNEPLLSDDASIKSKTRVLLDQTSAFLQSHVDRNGGRSSKSPSPPSGGSGSSRKLFSVKNRKTTALSKSSSIIDLLMGKPPATTPNENALYSGADRTDYFRVEISNADEPTFLPSEATRVGTPPLPTGGPGTGGARGFFFDYRSPGGVSNYEPSRCNTPSQGIVPTIELDIEEVAPFRFDPDSQPGHHFELNVPEHLPGSPLCPKSPLHPSRGKGICVYHGRNRTDTLLNDQ